MYLFYIWLFGAVVAFMIFSLAIVSIDPGEVASPVPLALYALWPLALACVIAMVSVVTVRGIMKRINAKHAGHSDNDVHRN